MADWWDNLTTRIGDALIAPQTFGSLLPAPTDPGQRQAMIAPALISLGANMMNAAQQGQHPMQAFANAYGGLQQQGAQQGQQRLQSALLMSKIGEQQKRNQTREALKKNLPPGMTAEMLDALPDDQLGKVLFDAYQQGQMRASDTGPAWMPGGGGGAAPPSGGGFNIGNLRAQGGGFQTFGTPEEAVAAAVRNVQRYPAAFNGGQPMTLMQVGARWAPKGDGANDPVQWARNVASIGGLPVDQPLDFQNPDVMQRFARGVHGAEFGQRALYQPDVYQRGVQALSGGSGGPLPVQPAQYTPQGQGVPAAPQGTPQTPQQSPQIDYTRDPVILQALQMRRNARNQQERDAADKMGAERVAALQKEAQTRADKPPRTQTVTTNEGVFLIDSDTGQVIRKVGDRPAREEGTPRDVTISGDLRKEFNNRQAVKDYQQVMPQVKAIRDAVPRDTRAADINIVFAFAKLLDPTSVVREGEQLTISKTGGVWDWLQGQAAKLNGGGMLTPDIRQSLQSEAESRFATYRDQYAETYEEFRNYFKESQLDPDKRFLVAKPLDPYQAPGQSGGQPGQQTITKGTRATNPQTGQEILWDGTQWIDVKTLKPVGATPATPTR